MADISQVKLPSGTSYWLKDKSARQMKVDGIAPNPASTTTDVDTNLWLSRFVSSPSSTASGNNTTINGSITGLFITNNNTATKMTSGQIVYTSLPSVNSSATKITLNISDSGNNKISGVILYNGDNLLGRDISSSNTIYPFYFNGTNWILIGDRSAAGDLSALEDRVTTLQNATVQGVYYVGKLDATSSAQMSDGATISTLIKADGTVVTFDDGTEGSKDPSDNKYGPGAIVIATGSNGQSVEYIWDGTKWSFLGSNTDNFGNLAYANTATGTYKPAGSVTVTNTPSTKTISFTTISGVGSVPSRAASTVVTGVTGGNFVTGVTTASIAKISGLGTLPSTESKTFVTGGTGVTGIGSLISTGSVTVATGLTGGTLPSASTGSGWASVSNEVLTLSPVLTAFSAGSFPTASTTSVKQVTGRGSLISTAALGTSTVRGVSGLGTLPSSASQNVIQAMTTAARTVSTAQIYSITGVGSVPSTATSTASVLDSITSSGSFSGTNATITVKP